MLDLSSAFQASNQATPTTQSEAVFAEITEAFNSGNASEGRRLVEPVLRKLEGFNTKMRNDLVRLAATFGLRDNLVQEELEKAERTLDRIYSNSRVNGEGIANLTRFWL